MIDLPSIRIGRRPGYAGGRVPDVRERWWMAGDPVASAWLSALSATFPRGEAFFVASLDAVRRSLGGSLPDDVRAFNAQEGSHSREHAAFNRKLAAAGHDLSRIEARVVALLAETVGRTPLQNLAATMALEHFTAIFAHDLLAHPGSLDGCEPGLAALWRWHAVEEIEHKAVAFDAFAMAAREIGPVRRYLLRVVTFLAVSVRFMTNRVIDTLDLLGQGGVRGRGAWLGMARFLLVRPGILRRVAPAWLSYLKPGFHPWDRDDRQLLARAQG
jgi:predicted metal-dependent hydrolase